MDVKRVAWESRPVEHRTIPADQRLVAMPVPTQKSAAASAGFCESQVRFFGSRSLGVRSSVAGAPSFASSAKGGGFDSGVRQGTASAVPKASTSPGASAPEAIALKSTLSPIVAAAAALAPVPDRQTIARIVEQVFTARDIPRRGGSAAASKSGNLADAGALADAPSFAPSAKGGDFASDVRQGTAFYPQERRAAVPKSDSEKGASAPEVPPRNPRQFQPSLPQHPTHSLHPSKSPNSSAKTTSAWPSPAIANSTSAQKQSSLPPPAI